MRPLYNLGIRLYGAALKIASVRNVKARKLVAGQHRALGVIARALEGKGDKRVWIHAASLGEFEQGRPLIERLRAERPDLTLILTFFSPSGYEVRRNYDKVDVVGYLPLDTPRNARRFLDIVRPSVAIFIKYEFWGNYLTGLSRRGIPAYIISAIFRPGQIFFRPWGGQFRRLLGTFRRLYVQDEASRQLLATVGVDRVTVAGDTRFDRVTAIMKKAIDLPEIDRFASTSRSVIIVAGSTWPADEDLLIGWLAGNPGVKAIFAPHEFDKRRLHALEARLSALGPTSCLSSVADGGDPSRLRFVIVDSFGLLAALYRKADIAYVGGGFGAGIHNINEAAAYGVPVVFGPRHQKFREASELASCGGGFPVDGGDTLGMALDPLVDNPGLRAAAGAAAGKYIADSIGATDRIFDDLFTTPSSHD